MIVGFTGSRWGMSDAQKAAVMVLMVNLEPTEAHHGDCVGADAEFHNIATLRGVEVTLHPPTVRSSRAFCWGVAKSMPPKDYMTRNREIVKACDVLIAAPHGEVEAYETRSGTWATIRAARKAGKRIFIVTPTRVIEEEAKNGGV